VTPSAASTKAVTRLRERILGVILPDLGMSSLAII